MATYTVTTTSDAVDPSDGVLSLREALALADADPATADTIVFAPEVQGQTIVLAGSQLTVNSDVTVDGGAGVTVDAHQQSRVLLVQSGTEEQPTDVALANLIITGGRTTDEEDGGGGIRAAAGYAALTLDHVTVSGNSTNGDGASGGGIRGTNVTMTNSIVSGNDNPALAGADLADAPPADQRGEARPQPAGSLPDVGAVEIDQTFSTGVPLTGRAVGFSGYEYLASYPDLEAAFGLDAGAAASHYLTTGRFEGRTVLFDGLEYVASHADLVTAFGADDDAGARHYLEFGRAEGRTTTFDGLEYIASYDDLVVAFGANRDAGSTHYIGHGAGEGRAPDAFDAAQYLANYQDLRDAFGDDQEAATVHYIAHGYSEGRTDAALAAAADFLS